MDLNALFSEKLGSVQFDLNNPGTQVSFLRGFAEGLHKEASLKPFEVVGILRFLVDQGGGHEKVALFPILPNPAAANRGLNWAGHQLGQAGQMINKGITTVKELPAAIHTAANSQAAIHQGIMGEMKQLPQMFSNGWDYFRKNYLTNANLKIMAPYAIAGLGSFLGAKTLGAGTGTAALAGIAGGAAGGYGWNHQNELYNRANQFIDSFKSQPQAAAAPTAQAQVDKSMAESTQHARGVLSPQK